MVAHARVWRRCLMAHARVCCCFAIGPESSAAASAAPGSAPQCLVPRSEQKKGGVCKCVHGPSAVDGSAVFAVPSACSWSPDSAACLARELEPNTLNARGGGDARFDVSIRVFVGYSTATTPSEHNQQMTRAHWKVSMHVVATMSACSRGEKKMSSLGINVWYSRTARVCNKKTTH